MTVTELSQLLNSKYSVKAMIDLSDLSQSPWAAYRFFHKLYQAEFADHDRIVLYTSQEIPDRLLQHLYKMTEAVDISNFFVLICSTIDISQRLKNLAEEKSSWDSFQNFNSTLEETKSFEDLYNLPDTICAIPWMHAEIEHDGTITPCCQAKGLTLGNINNTAMEDAFYSQAMENLRSQFLAGEKPKACDNCWQKESRKLSSIRTHNITRLRKDFFLEYLEQPKITTLDLKFNNTCNFKCRICNPTNSSLIATEHKKFFNINTSPQSNWAESENFLDQMIKMLPQITNIDMFGGEPFLIKKFTNVLHTAVEQGHAKNIRLHYNSNGSIWPAEFIPYWPHFREVDIHFSIDAIGPRFELQRGGSWSDVEKNILRIKNLNFPNMVLNLMPTISILSVYYMDEVYDWAKKHNFDLFASNLVDPLEFNLNNLTKHAQELIIDKFQNHPWSEMQDVVKFLKKIPPSDGIKFIEKIKSIDIIRKENFADSHQEIAEAMGYVYNKTL
jgi:radical SAM protein with 4Fe4S-binding SPASM domain